MTTLNNSAQNQLRQFIEQLERLEEEKKAIGDDIKEKFAEAKALGFDVKIMKQVLRLRKKSKADREEEEAILATYLHALGMTPMERYIAEAESRAEGAGASGNGADSKSLNREIAGALRENGYQQDDEGVWWKRDEHGALMEVGAP